MTSSADFLIVGGGIAGLSAASRLVGHGKAIVLEAEDALGYHSSGRSVSFSHYGIGNIAVRGLTAWSRPFFEAPPDGPSSTPLARSVPSLYFADEEALPALDALEAEMARFTDRIRRIDPAAMAALCPALRTGGGAAVDGVLDPDRPQARCRRPSPGLCPHRSRRRRRDPEQPPDRLDRAAAATAGACAARMAGNGPRQS